MIGRREREERKGKGSYAFLFVYKVEEGTPPPFQKTLSFNGVNDSHLQDMHDINILPFTNYYM